MKHTNEPPDRRWHGSTHLHIDRRRKLDQLGFEDAPPLSLQTLDGEHPRGRELSIAWLAGTVMTGITSVMLMGAALYVAFDGKESFSTASQALSFRRSESVTALADSGKTDRLRPRTQTRSELEVLQASIRTVVEGRTVLRNQAFTRVDVTLATAETPLAADVPPFDPSAIVTSAAQQNNEDPSPEIYGANVDGEVAIATSPLPALSPAIVISDRQAADFAKSALQDSFLEAPTGGFASTAPEVALAYTPTTPGAIGTAENVTVVSKALSVGEGGGRSERIVTLQQEGGLEELLLKNGFTEQSYQLVAATLRNVLPSLTLPAGAKLRILMGPSRTSAIPIPYRLSIYFHDPKTKEIRHAATAAMTDRGGYVIGLEPGAVEFPDEDIEAVEVTALPSLYRSIWETARKYDIDDETTSQIVAMFAYELDLTQKVRPGDGLKLLATKPATEQPELLYASLTTGGTTRELFRFRAPDGTVDFYSPDGETGKRFLTRRPLQGGGRLASRYGYRIHPIFKSRRLHSGVDLAAPLGTPVYAGGDGTVRRAQWVSGYGRYVELDHVNGFQTGYAHMSRIADGLKPGMRVKQGQLIGYVGSTGNSTGNHLHYEIRINDRTVDPLSVKLPRDKELSARLQEPFLQTTDQIRSLMDRAPGEDS